LHIININIVQKGSLVYR